MASWPINGETASSPLLSSNPGHFSASANNRNPMLADATEEPENGDVSQWLEDQSSVLPTSAGPGTDSGLKASATNHGNAQQSSRDEPRRQEQENEREPLHYQPNKPNPKRKLSDYRQKLASDMSARVVDQPGTIATPPLTKRPSPIEEENTPKSGSFSNSSSISNSTATSTRSSAVIRSEGAAKTDSSTRTQAYPFPRMSGSNPNNRHGQPEVNHFDRLRPAQPQEKPSVSNAATGSASGGITKARRPEAHTHESKLSVRSDKVLSTPSTPASAATFLPETAFKNRKSAMGGSDHWTPSSSLQGQKSRRDAQDFESPNLYDLVLTLSSEPGLESWWNNVVKIATEFYRAERVALIIPSDSTDVENMPWGQKATYNAHEKDDELSLGYVGVSSSFTASATSAASGGPETTAFFSPTLEDVFPTPPGPTRRPALTTRYSYTAFEDRKEKKPAKPTGAGHSQSRPSLLRCQTSEYISTERTNVPKSDYLARPNTSQPVSSLNHEALEELDAAQALNDQVPAWEKSFQPQHDVRARVLPVLQSLDYEADPLIDHFGVQRVLDRGHVVALTRSYPYLDSSKESKATMEHQRNQQAQKATEERNSCETSQTSRIQPNIPAEKLHHKLPTSINSSSSAIKAALRPWNNHRKLLAGLDAHSRGDKFDEASNKNPHRYEECEQIPLSPWSQSPAASPVVRGDSDENPFFERATLDEDCFNPTSSSPEDYTELQTPKAIGVDNSWTILHVPLYHPLLSKPSPAFKLNTEKMARRCSPNRKSKRAGPDDTASTTAAPSMATSPSAEPAMNRPKQMPIAILSILSPIIPYPTNLRHSIEFLAPHLAASYSLCLHYSTLEAEVAGLTRRRHEPAGFGGVDTDGRPLASTPAYLNSLQFPSTRDDAAAHRSAAGSMTSYSDYSIQSRSIFGSPGGTPGWDSSSLDMFLDRKANAGNTDSPGLAPMAGDGYFGVRPSTFALHGRPATTPGGQSNPIGGGDSGRGAPGSSGGTGRRPRKNSVSQNEKRLTSLRMPETVAYNTEAGTNSNLQHAIPVPEQQDGLPPFEHGPSTSIAGNISPVAQQKQNDSAKPLADGLASIDGNVEISQMSSMLPERTTSLRQGNVPYMIAPQRKDTKKQAREKEFKLDEERLVSRDTKASAGTQNSQGFQAQAKAQSLRRGPMHRQSQSHGQLHSYGADFSATFPSLPPNSSISVNDAGATSMAPNASVNSPSRTGAVSAFGPVDLPPPSDRLKSLILDSLPAHVFVAMPQTGAVVWVNSRYLAYRGQTADSLAEDPWASIHPDEREDYLKAWSHSVRTGDQFSRTVRIRRFDGSYRWFHARAVASRDRRNTVVHILGSYMDIHDQHIAELKAARQEEIEASEAKHRLLANLIPQIIFTANEEEGITFVNEPWAGYTGQDCGQALGLGFINFVHPDDFAKCSFLPVPAHLQERRKRLIGSLSRPSPGDSGSENTGATKYNASTAVSNNYSNSKEAAVDDGGLSELAELARRGIILATTDDNGRPSYTTEVRLRSKTGEYRWHLVRCVETGTMDFGKGYNSYFGSATDINDHKLLETKLKEAMDSKTRFLSNMSHEIRTPLIGISGMVSFLQDTTLNEEQRDYTNTIQTSANSLLMIINDILDLSKVDAGMMKLKFEWFHTRSLIEDVNELVSTMAIAKGLELNYIVDAEVPSWVKGDRVRIRQVLLNVIGNAIKFTARGEVFSRCRVVEPASSQDTISLEFSVTDTGQGFTKEEADLIFKPFSQIDGSSTRQHGGSGLGLVISRQLVELHGGIMSGTAVPGKGSTFTFTATFSLPTDSDHPDSSPTSPPLTAEASSSASVVQGSSLTDPAAVFASASSSSAGARALAAAAAATGATAAALRGGSTNLSIFRPSHPRSFSDRNLLSSKHVAGLARFGEAARASGQDLSQIHLNVTPPNPSSSERTLAPPSHPIHRSSDSSVLRSSAPEHLKDATVPSKFVPSSAGPNSALSILIICPQSHSREATTKHIEMTLPKEVRYRIRSLATAAEAHRLIGGDKPETFTHVVINLPSPQEILELVDQLSHSAMLGSSNVLVLSDSVQRQAVNRLAAGTRYEELLSEANVTYIYKPVKPSRFAVIFDPAKERDLSIDHNRSTAQRLVNSQKQSYVDLEQRMGNKGYKVLLVEDNMVNQKVMKKYLQKVGVEVDLAADGVECTDIVFSHPHDYYSVILCDLHMPRKDGYQACREIREWENEKIGNAKEIPIIALSANVMSDVHDKCVEAGFNKYITKPVDFIDLSHALSDFF